MNATAAPAPAPACVAATEPAERRVLVVIPSYVSSDRHVDLLHSTLESVMATTSPETTDVVVVDDGSPRTDWMDGLEAQYDLRVGLIACETNEGFSRTVNKGLAVAHADQMDAVLLNADITCVVDGWVETMQRTRSQSGDLAGIVGAKLIYPDTGLVQHAGIYWSRIHKAVLHRYHMCDPSLPAVNEPKDCPVTAAMQFVRWETLDRIGLFSEEYRLSFEDVEYCLRALENGLSCTYNPQVVAFHHESAIRGEKTGKVKRWEHDSWWALVKRCEQLDLEGMVDGQ